ncbi:MAG: ABC transporter [Gloeocapsa sp. DLM2.Bin57]|nr:MAG: ABC transporter [Gloeocapsa sp. DLM2.Bin57]
MKYNKYLYLLGILIAIVGLIIGLISQQWLPIPVSLLALGLIVTIALMGLSSPTMAITSNGILASLAFIIILGLLNYLIVSNEVRIDFTENQVFTLSSQSQTILRNLNQPVKVWVFQTQVNPRDLALLRNYQRHNEQFSFEFVDPEIQIELAREFEIQNQGEVYLEYQDKRLLIQTISEVEPLLEAILTSGIQAIQRDRPAATLYFLQGHGETELNATEDGLSQAVESLTSQGYQVETLNLATVDRIPEDTRVIIIISPKRRLLDGEIEVLQNYLSNGGKLLLMLDPQTNLGFTELLADWGIELDQRMVIDVSGAGTLIGFGPATVIITNYGDHPITQTFGEEISLYHLARPISTTPKPDIDSVALLITNEQTWAESRLDGQEIEFDPEEDIPGPLDIGVALSRDNSRLVVIGNTTFATNGWFKQQLNEDMFLNTIEWLVGESEEILSIRPKEPKNRRLNLTTEQANILGWLALVLVPLAGFLVAIITWWRRR